MGFDHALQHARGRVAAPCPVFHASAIGQLGWAVRAPGRWPGQGAAVVAPPEDTTGPVDLLEQAAVVFDGLAVAQEQCAAAVQGVMEQLDDPVLRLAVEVDQQIPAGDQVDAGEGRVVHHILRCKHDGLANELLDREAGVVPVEIPVDQIIVDPVQCVRLVSGVAPAVEGIQVQVGGEDQELHRLAQLARDLAEQDGQGIGFLAAGTTRHPHAEHLRVVTVRQHLGQVVAQGLEGFRITKELGDRDQQIAHQRLAFDWVLFQQAGVVRHVVQMRQAHALANAAVDRGALVV